MGQQVVIPHESCGHRGTTRFGQIIVSSRLLWYRSISCPACGRIEEDGEGLPPEEFRAHLLQEGGRWKLVARGPAKSAAIKVIRRALAVPLGEAFRLFPVLYIGTKTEVEWLKAQMEASNVAANIAEIVEA